MASLNWGYSVLTVFVLWLIVYYFGVRDYWTIAGTLCVCVKFFVCGCVCGMCVCMCERDCTLHGVWLRFWPKTISLRFHHLSFGTISFLNIFNHQSRLTWNSPGEWIGLSEVCWTQCCFVILIKSRNPITCTWSTF